MEKLSLLEIQNFGFDCFSINRAALPSAILGFTLNRWLYSFRLLHLNTVNVSSKMG